MLLNANILADILIRCDDHDIYRFSLVYPILENVRLHNHLITYLGEWQQQSSVNFVRKLPEADYRWRFEQQWEYWKNKSDIPTLKDYFQCMHLYDKYVEKLPEGGSAQYQLHLPHFAKTVNCDCSGLYHLQQNGMNGVRRTFCLKKVITRSLLKQIAEKNKSYMWIPRANPHMMTETATALYMTMPYSSMDLEPNSEN